MQGFELAATLVATADFQNFLGGPRRPPEGPPGRGKSSVHAPSVERSSSKQIDCIFAMDYGGLGPPTLHKCSQSARRTGHCKYGVNRPGGPRRGTLGRPRSFKLFFKEASQLRSFCWGSFCPHSRWPLGPLNMQGYELATLFVAPLDFQNFCEEDLRKLVGVLAS